MLSPPVIPVLYVDDHLLVVSKPAGLPSLVDGYLPEAPFLVGILKETYPALWVVHRLDRQTSGVIVFARTAAAHRLLNTQFEQRQAIKTYHALVHGSPAWENRSVRLPLRPNGDRRHRTVVDHQHGKSAETDLLILARFDQIALLQATPRSGRPHQIRAHLAALGYPIVCDALYGGAQLPGEQPPNLARLGLHAWSLKLFHPDSGAQMEFHAPYPEDMAQAIDALRLATILDLRGSVPVSGAQDLRAIRKQAIQEHVRRLTEDQGEYEP